MMINESIIDQLKYRKIELDKISIKYLNLSSRVNTALKTRDLNTVLELIECPDDYILSIRNLGKTSLRQIKEHLSEFIESLLNLDDSTLYSVGIFIDPENIQSIDNKTIDNKNIAIDNSEENGFIENPILDLDYAFEQLFEPLTIREKNVCILRFGLYDGNPRTLEEIGRLLNNLGRGRVGQIVKKARRRILHHSVFYVRKTIEKSFEEMFLRAGGVLNQRDIPQKLSEVATFNKIHPNGVAKFVFSTSHQYKPIDDKIWALNDYYASQFANISSQANLILERYKARMNLNYLVGEVFTNIHLDNQVIKTNMIMPYIESCIKADPQIEIIKIVDEDWCILSTWHLLHIQDIVKVLNNYGKPLHYRAITNFINLQSEKSEKVIRHHIRRILQRRPDFFVLYEHGTFGLVEWGIARSPTILYYLYEILKLEGNPLSIDEIYGRIKELLFCGRTSIIMCLTENNYFVEFQLGMYGLREWVDIKKQGQET